MPLNGKPLDFTKRFLPCKHIHASGRRCANRIPKDKLYCDLHGAGQCWECKAMLRVFSPKKGWGEIRGE